MPRRLTPSQEGEVDAVAANPPPKSMHPLVQTLYMELKRLARQRVRSLAANPTLGPTALVHEVVFRLSRDAVDETDHEGFLRLAACAMQHVVIDHARQRQTKTRGGGRRRLQYDEAAFPAIVRAAPEQLTAVAAAIDEFARQSPEAERAGEFFRLHFFAGLTYDQIATSCGTSSATVRRGCEYARASLRRALELGDYGHESPA